VLTTTPRSPPAFGALFCMRSAARRITLKVPATLTLTMRWNASSGVRALLVRGALRDGDAGAVHDQVEAAERVVGEQRPRRSRPASEVTSVGAKRAPSPSFGRERGAVAAREGPRARPWRARRASSARGGEAEPGGSAGDEGDCGLHVHRNPPCVRVGTAVVITNPGPWPTRIGSQSVKSSGSSDGFKAALLINKL